MIDVWQPKDLRYHFVDDIIPIVTGLYDRKFRLSGLSRKMQNVGMHKSRDMWRQRKHAKTSLYELWHTTGTSRVFWSARTR